MPNPRLSMRLTEADARLLNVIAAHVQATRHTPFVAPADAIRAALVLAANHIVAERTVPTARTAG